MLLKAGQKSPPSSKTDAHCISSAPVTFPLSCIIFLGPQDVISLTPSSRAISISHGFAGISSLLSRQAMVTSFAPTLRAVRATSTATLPPPTTNTLSLRAISLPSLISARKSIPQKTSSDCAPSRSIFRLSCNPVAMKTASKPSAFNVSRSKSLPSFFSVLSSIPTLKT